MWAEVALPDAAGVTRAELLGALHVRVDELKVAGRQVESAGKLAVVSLTGGFFGPLTGLEVLGLASVHLRHHAKQLLS